VASHRTAEAIRMLEVFASVGAESFDITHTNIKQEKRGFRSGQTLAQATGSMPFLVPSAARRHNNLIVRPHATTMSLIQLDDLAPENLARIAPVAFLVLQTSPKGIQAWVAVHNAPTGFLARLREGVHADRTASGATRVAGTANFKEHYAPNFPIVRIVEAQPGLIVAPATLEVMGVVAPPRPTPPPLPFAASTAPRTHKWPDYGRCLENAPIGTSGNPKRTSADFIWCKIALSWGHSIEATAARLMEVSTKAQENSEAYALKTATHAEYAARQRNAKPRQPRPSGM
jgi:hypothetical protein